MVRLCNLIGDRSLLWYTSCIHEILPTLTEQFTLFVLFHVPLLAYNEDEGIGSSIYH